MKKSFSVLGIFTILFYAPVYGQDNVIYPADAQSRIVDVTKAPYNADKTGATDATAAIQAALDFAAGGPNIIYLPNGTYKVSNRLNWGGTQKRDIMIGQSRDLTIIKLADNAPGYANPAAPKAVMWTGTAPAQRFSNGIRNLTVNTGSGNPGATGIQFMANNQGGMDNVLIKNNDNQGVYGLDLGYSDEQGPCLMKRIEVVGFNIGIRTKYAVDGVVMSNITLRNQLQYGIHNDGQCLSIENLNTTGSVPALYNIGAGVVAIINSTLTGTGAASGIAAITNINGLFARNITTTGFLKAIDNQKGGQTTSATTITEFVSHPVVQLFTSPTSSLGLPIKPTPQVTWDTLSNWVNVGSFPADSITLPNGRRVKDFTNAFQRAIDAGKSTVYFGDGSGSFFGTVYVRGNVKLIMGMEAWMGDAVPDAGGIHGKLVIEAGTAPVVQIERFSNMYNSFDVVHRANRTAVFKNMMLGDIVTEPGAGDFFVEDAHASSAVIGQGTNVWGRQWNTEGDVPARVLNQGGNIWILGIKTEDDQVAVRTMSGGQSEIIGGFIYSNKSRNPDKIIFVNDEGSRFSATVGEWVIRNQTFHPVSETRDGVTKVMPIGYAPGRGGGSMLPLYTGYRAVAADVPSAAPTALCGSAPRYGVTEISWTDNSNNEDGFLIERKIGSGDFVPYNMTFANQTTFRDTLLTPSTTYAYRVKAVNSKGQSAYSNTVSCSDFSGAACNCSAITTITYTPKDYTDLSLTSSWEDLFGNSPANFTSPNQIFLITPKGIYRAPLYVSRPWTISGGSKVVLQHQYNLEFRPAASLNIGAGSEVNFNNYPVILKSDATGTASIGTIGGTISNASKITTEHFIPARRAWRMINAPIAGSQSINAAWQENPTTASPNPIPIGFGTGFGTHITGGSVAQGFDQSPTNSSSIKTYDNATDNWLPLPNTNGTSVSNNVFMLFVRGDRTIDLTKGTAAAPTTTVLRSTGALRTGDQTFTVNATGFTPVPNPYPSAINFATITKNNVQNSFYVWDPKMSGPDGVGAFVNVSFNGSTYDVTPTPASPVSQYIQSHQSFLVRSTGAAGSLVIKETDKSTGGSDNVFRTGGVSQSMRVNLLVNNADNTTSVADGVLSSYSADFSNAIDDMDAVKMTNFNENIGIVRNGQILTVERRSAISLSDTIFLKLWNTAQTSYHLQFDPANFSSGMVSAYLVDNYLHTSTPVSMSSISNVEFTVTANTASAAADRFMVVFKANSTLPVNFTTIKAYQQSNNVQVDWNVATESNILSYEIEKSSNGVMFTKAATVAAKANNNAAVAYNWIDVAPYVGNNYYRIKAVTLTGDVKYTQVVNVKTAKGRSEITAYPNPLTGRTINIQLVNQPAGTYTVELINNIGQLMYRSEIKHLGGSSAQTLDLDNKPAQGVYQMKISNGDTKKTIQIICN